MSLKLYEITEAIEALEEQIVDRSQAGADPSALVELLDDLKIAGDMKIVNIAKLVRNWSAEIDAKKTEERRLREERKKLEASLDNLKKYGASYMDGIGRKQLLDSGLVIKTMKLPAKSDAAPDLDKIGKVEGKVVIGELQLGAPNVSMNVPKELDPKFWRVEVRVEPAKSVITRSWRETGLTPEGAVIMPGERTLIVK